MERSFISKIGSRRYRVYDISVRVHEGMPRWPGDHHDFEHRFAKTMDRDGVSVSRLSFNLHTGTHLDAPSHHLEAGDTIEKIPLEKLIGAAQVVDLCHVESVVKPADLEGLESGRSPICLIKTRNAALWEQAAFCEDYVSLSPDAAAYLVDRGIEVVGVDYLSVEPFGEQSPETHRTLLGAGVAVIEGLDLGHVAAGEFTLICMPLKLEGTEAAPVRAVLLQEEDR